MCVNNSFVVPGDYESDNKFLKEDKDWAYILNVNVHPSITINNMTYKGDLDGFDIAHAICAGFKDRPVNCKHVEIQKVQNELANWGKTFYEPVFGAKSFTGDLIIAGALICLANLLCVGLHIWKSQNR